MAVVTLNAPDSHSVTLSTAYLGGTAWLVVSGSGVDVASDDAAIALTCKMWAVDDAFAVIDGTEYEEIGSAGIPQTFLMSKGQKWILDIKAASGTPAAKVRVY